MAKAKTQEEMDEIAEDTQAGRALHTIRAMRSRTNLATIINAAEARDSHLASIESEEERKRLWSKFTHLKKGDTVFVHKQPEGKNSWLWGKPLYVVKVQPRSKIIHVRGDERGVGVKLTPHMMYGYKLSLEPTTAAFANSLVGKAIARSVRPT